MSTEIKDVIYVDVDDEITGIVNKITNSKKSIIALVLPKRASSLQSIVNMKLLKRSAAQNDKKLVLITSEIKLLPLAGAAGLYVASNLTSKPYIPPSPQIGGAALADGAENIDPNTPVSSLAPNAKYASDSDAIEIDNTPKNTDSSSDAPVKKPETGKKDKKKKVPSFSSFRKKAIIIAVALLLLISSLIWAFSFAPKGKLTVKAQTSDVPVNITFTADQSISSVDIDKKLVRASLKELSKNDSEKVDATGEKNNGNKASGTMTLRNCESNFQLTIPAGTGISSGDFTFVTQQAVTLDDSAVTPSNICISGSKDVPVIAQQGGDEYNLSARDYAVAGHSKVEATGSAMSGGTSKIVKVVAKTDINKAKERLNSKQNTAEDDIKKELIEEGYIPVEDTFKTKEGTYNSSPAIDTEAKEVTVSITNEYSMLGVKKEDVQELVKKQVNEDQKDKAQSILNDGIDSAIIKKSISTASVSEGQTLLTVETKSVVGPEINEDEIKNLISGKKKGEAEELIKKRAGLSDPRVELSPFWVSKVPKASKITIEVQKADGAEL